MISLGRGNTVRIFKRADVEELIPFIRRVTTRAHKEIASLTDHYGPLTEHDPEWEILKSQTADVIDGWASKIRRVGAEPCELWTVRFHRSSDPDIEKDEWQLAFY